VTHVLIVDDEPSIRETFQAFLEDEGYDVVTAADFFEAEKILTSTPREAREIDVVVADIVLPRVNGLALLRQVREVDGDIPVIMITGEPDVSTAAEAVRYGAYDYVAKPVTQKVLVRIVGRAAEKKHLLDEKRRLEAENRAYQANLEKMVAERTAELERRNQEMAVLIEIGRASSSTLDPTEVMEIVTENVVTRLGYKTALVSSYTEEDNSFTMGAVYPRAELLTRAIKLIGYDPWKLKFSFDPQVNPGFEQLLRGHIWVTTSFHDFVRPVLDKRVADALQRLYGTRYNVNVPMWVRGKLVGTIVAARETEIDAEAQEVLIALARQSALAIENARLHSEAERRLKEMTALHETALDITAQLEMSRLLDAIIARASDLLGATGGLVHLYDPAREKLVAVTSCNLTRDYTGLTLEIGEGVAGKVFQAGKPLIVDDHRAWAGKSPQVADAGARSILGIPLQWQGRIIGVLDIMDNVRVAAFDEDDLRLLVPFANQAAIAIENARLFDEERNSRRLADTLREIAQALNSTLSLREVLDLILTELEKVIAFDTGSIMLLEGRDLVVRAVKGFADPNGVIETHLNLEIASLNREVVESKRPLIIGSVHEDERWLKAMEISGLKSELRHIRSWMGIPLIAQDQVIGILTTDKREAHFYSERDAEIALTFANHAAIAIENARLYGETRRHADELAILHDIDIAITSTLDLDEVLQIVHEHIEAAMDITAFYIGLYDEERGELYFPLTVEEGEQLPPLTLKVEEDGGLSGWVVRARQPLWIEDMEKERDSLPAKVIYRGIPTRSLMILPLVVKDRVVGVISVQSSRPHAFDENHRGVFYAIASQVAIAIENTRLFKEINRRLTETRLLQEVIQAAASTLDFDEVLARTIQTLHRTLGIEYLGFALPDDGGTAMVAHPSMIGFPLAPGETVRLPLDRSIIGRVYRTGEPLLIPNVRQAPDYFEIAPEARSELAVPVRVGDEVIAVLNAESSELAAFDEDDLHLFSAIATQLGVVLKNARLYRRLEDQAAELSRAYDELQEISRLRTELVQNVGHELRTPLGLIKGYVELLLSGDLDDISENQRKALQVVRAHTATLERLVYNLTMLQTVPREALALSAVSVVEVVRHRLAELHRSAKRANIIFQTELPANLPPVLGDREWLELAFSHLVDNAVKFSPDGGVVTIRAWADRTMVYVSIADEGIGIPSEHLSRIFERFYQVDGSARRRFGGMGVGLALVWEIVTAHGGAVSVESEPGKGSTFTVALPQAT